MSMPTLEERRIKGFSTRARELFCRDPDLTCDEAMQMLDNEGYEPRRE